jgi:molybdopterin-containing oxidoreductase family membrane subunit
MAGEQKIRRTADMLPPVVAPQYTVGSVSDKISGIVLTKKTPRPWYFGVALAMVVSLMLFNAIGYLLLKGVGVWGVDVPVAWGFAIVNFVWWIGIGHAGTLISAILLLLKQEWRTSINRFAEAMTLFAVACAGMFPLLHLGRPWVFYWLFPYPDTMGLWPQWRSPLVWDVFAVSTYATVSLLFWYVGLIPDLATLRDKAQNRIAQVIYGIGSLGWRGSAMHWHRYEIAYLLLGGLATPLVVSVHSIVGMDFAGGIVPGWHSTIFPPYFVAGAIFSGFAMVATLTIPLRKWYGLEGIITIRHLDNMGKIMLATGLIVAYGYAMEVFIGYYSDNTYEWFMTTNRMFGPYAWAYWMLIFCNILTPITLWSRKVRTTPIILFIISIIINVGMWMERYVIVITSLHRDFLPSSWGMYAGTQWDWMTYLGTLGFFALCLILFIRVLPMISMFEMRQLVSQYREDAGTSAQVALQED